MVVFQGEATTRDKGKKSDGGRLIENGVGNVTPRQDTLFKNDTVPKE